MCQQLAVGWDSLRCLVAQEVDLDKNCRWLEFATRSSVITIRGLRSDDDERAGEGAKEATKEKRERRRRRRRGQQMNPSGLERMAG